MDAAPRTQSLRELQASLVNEAADVTLRAVAHPVRFTRCRLRVSSKITCDLESRAN